MAVQRAPQQQQHHYQQEEEVSHPVGIRVNYIIFLKNFLLINEIISEFNE